MLPLYSAVFVRLISSEGPASLAGESWRRRAEEKMIKYNSCGCPSAAQNWRATALTLRLFQINCVLSYLIEGGHGLGIGFKRTLRHDEVGKFGCDIDIGELNRPA